MRIEYTLPVKIALILIVGLSYAQDISPSEGSDASGSTGLFFSPSPSTLGTGNFRIGMTRIPILINNVQTYSSPMFLSLGFTDRSEIFVSTLTTNMSNQYSDRLIIAGIKTKIIDLKEYQLSLNIGVHSLDRTYYNSPSNTYNSYSLQALNRFNILEMRLYSNIGYHFSDLSEFDKPNLKDNITAGFGILIPLWKKIQGISEIQKNILNSKYSNTIGSVGLKWFLFNHIQLAAGSTIANTKNGYSNGYFINVSFTSENVSVFRRIYRKKQKLPLPPPITNFLIKNEITGSIKKDENIRQDSYSNFDRQNSISSFTGQYQELPPLNELDLWEKQMKLTIRSSQQNADYSQPLIFPALDKYLDKSKQQKSVKNQEKLITKQSEIKKIMDDGLPIPPPLKSLNSNN